MNNIIIGTAGHVDHGKTTLIYALTGVFTDFLKEEKERNISINLGFTNLISNNEKTIGIIDVPGHEKFIKNMMVGARGMTAIMLVIDINSGIMPQTLEHINIIDALHIKKKIIVLTKISKLSKEEKEIKKSDIIKNLEHTSFNNAPVFLVDSISKEGIDTLKKFLLNLEEDYNYKIDNSSTLYVDRCISMQGHGTVVTGTLLDNNISIGDNLVLLPKNINVKVRNLQVHSNNVKKAYRSQRTAINLSGIDYKDIHRGDILTTSTMFKPCYMVLAKIKLSSNYKKQLKHWDRIRFFYGASEILARIVPLITSNSYIYAQIRFEKEIYIKNLEYFVIRSFSPATTIGGGQILSVEQKKYNKKSINDRLIRLLSHLENNDYISYIDYYLSFNDFLSIEFIQNNFYEFDSKTLESKYYLSDNYILNKNIFNNIQKNILELIEKSKNILGINKPDIYKNFLYPKEIIDTIISKTSAIVLSGNKLKLKNSTNDIDSKIKSSILSELDSSEFLEFKKYENIIKNNINDVNYLLKNKDIIKLNEGFVITKSTYEKAKKILITYLNDNNSIDAKTYKQLLGCGRRNAILLLEKFDTDKITRRVGNDRELINKIDI